jgi:hypothetical protein
MRSHGVAVDSIDRHKVAITAESPRRNVVRVGALPSLAVADERRSAEKTPSLPRGSLFPGDEGPLVAVGLNARGASIRWKGDLANELQESRELQAESLARSPPSGTGVCYQSAAARRRRPARGPTRRWWSSASEDPHGPRGCLFGPPGRGWGNMGRKRGSWPNHTFFSFFSFLFQISDIQIKFEFLFKFFRFQLSIYNSKVKVNPISIIIYSSTYYLIINGLIRIPFLIFYFIFSFMSWGQIKLWFFLIQIKCITKITWAWDALFFILLFYDIHIFFLLLILGLTNPSPLKNNLVPEICKKRDTISLV